MGKIAFVADVHLGNHRRHGGPLSAGLNDRARQTLGTLRRAMQAAMEHGCTRFVVCGDLLDSVRPAAQLLAMAQTVLWASNMDVFILKGNHDSASDHLDDHALGVFDFRVEVLQFPLSIGCGDFDLWGVPFQSGAASGWLPEVLSELEREDSGNGGSGRPASPARLRVLALHLGISDARTPAWLRGARDAIDSGVLRELMEKHGICRVFAGNWHHHQVWAFPGSAIHQIGALVPTGWDNPGLEGYGGLVIFDPERVTVERVEIPGPRFVDFTAPLPAEPPKTANRLFARVFAKAAARDAALLWAARCKEKGMLHAVEVLPDSEEIAAAARSAAAGARSAETLEDSAARYIAGMPLGGHVDRAAVGARVRKYLGI